MYGKKPPKKTISQKDPPTASFRSTGRTKTTKKQTTKNQPTKANQDNDKPDVRRSERPKVSNKKLQQKINDSEDLGDDDSDVSDRPWNYSSGSEADDSDNEAPTLQQWSKLVVDHPVEDFKLRRGPRHDLPVDATEYDYLELFLDVNFYEGIARETNRYAEHSQRVKDRVDSRWIPVTAPEMRAYFGILIYMGIIKAPTPGQDLSVDEAMIAFNGRLLIKQYMPAKPTKWGIKVWTIADPKSGYMLGMKIYLGKKEPTQDKSLLLGEQVVLNMTEPFSGKFHHVFFDNFFSSVRLVELLMLRKLYSCGTIRANRKE
ncbi:uncharacterized protein LOC107045284 [Diachasma alloeum]|uniref:uncharacterized protein LOC107045284 n=1 Tax=Diachasma alloeum TaxID=454923 RepID=UPI0007384318|nr:uncharacterized protein LOC107045284 [Diachasma alloeum]